MKQRIIAGVIEREGGYVNDSSDSGGETNWGVTISVARRFGYSGPMIDMPRSTAFEIYSALYWDAVCGDDLARLSEPLCEKVADIAVNMGAGRAGKFLQRCLNALNDRERYYSDIKVDGDVGPATIRALVAYLSRRKAEVLIKGIKGLQAAFYIELAERRNKDERFVYGWLKNRV